MKTLHISICCICLLLTACNGNNSKRKISSHEEEENIVYLDKKFIGQWVNKEYLDMLSGTRSPKKAQEGTELAFINLYEDSRSYLNWSLHEGDDRKAVAKDDNTLMIMSEIDTNHIILRLIDRKTMLLQHGSDLDTLIKYDMDVVLDQSTNKAINDILFAGDYVNLEDDKKIVLKADGSLKGLGNYNQYTVPADYYDAGLNLDLIYFKNEQEEVQFTWEINKDTLNIYEVECATYDEETETCVELSKGNIILKLLKKGK